MKNLTLGSLFSGSGGFELAGMLAGITPIWNSEIEPYPILVTHNRLPSVQHYGDISKLNGAELPPVDMITFGSPCFPEGTLVLTEEGYIPIEKVEVGMKVLTHRGKWKNVTATGAKFAETVLLRGNHYGLECTPNHPIYSSGEKKYYPQLGNGKRGNQTLLTEEKAWIPAEKMCGRLWAVPKFIESLPVASPVYSGSGKQKRMPPLSDSLFYFIGRWLGDGWVCNGQRSGRSAGATYGKIFLCDSYDKEEELRRTVESVSERYTVAHERTVVKFSFSSQVLAEWLTANFGQYAAGKKMPGWVFGLPFSYRQNLLRGLFDSNGSIVKGKENTRKISTISKPLAESIRILAESLNYSTTVHMTVAEKTKVIEGRTVNQHDYYTVVVTKSTKRKHLTDELHGWYRVRSMIPTGKIKVVYNLTVDEDNSYVADGIVVHNCQDMSIAGKRAGLNGERSGLFHQAVRVIKEMRCATNGEYPRFIVWENVSGAFSSDGGEDFRIVLEEICKIKKSDIFIPRPSGKWTNAGEIVADDFSVAYRMLDAQYFGVPQRRKRIYLVADFAEKCAGKILFESEGVPWHTPEGFRTWEGTAGSAEESTGASGGICLCDQGGERIDVLTEKTATLRAESHHPPCVISAGFCTEHSAKARGIGYEEEKSPTLRTNTVPAALLFENHSADTRYKGPLEISPTISANLGMGGNNQPFVVETPKTLKIRCGGGSGGKGALIQDNLSSTLACNNDQTVFQPKVYGICSKYSNSMLSENPHSGFYEAETARTIDTSDQSPSKNQGGMVVLEGNGTRPSHKGNGYKESETMYTLNTVEVPAVAFSQDAYSKYSENEKSSTLRAKGGMYGGGSETLIYSTSKNSHHTSVEENIANTLVASDYKDPPAVAEFPQYIVRRLTPTECARLQGLPDWWCKNLDIPNPDNKELSFWKTVWNEWNSLNGKKPKSESQIRRWLANPYSDSAEYKLYGNAIAVPCAFFVLSGIAHYAGYVE